MNKRLGLTFSTFKRIHFVQKDGALEVMLKCELLHKYRCCTLLIAVYKRKQKPCINQGILVSACC